MESQECRDDDAGPHSEVEPPPASASESPSTTQITRSLESNAASSVTAVLIKKRTKLRNANPRQSDAAKIESAYIGVATISACAELIEDVAQLLSVVEESDADNPAKMKQYLRLIAKCTTFAEGAIKESCNVISKSLDNTAAKKQSAQVHRKLTTKESRQWQDLQIERHTRMKQNPSEFLKVSLKQCEDVVKAASTSSSLKQKASRSKKRAEP
jgi:hypothetical protein